MLDDVSSFRLLVLGLQTGAHIAVCVLDTPIGAPSCACGALRCLGGPCGCACGLAAHTIQLRLQLQGIGLIAHLHCSVAQQLLQALTKVSFTEVSMGTEGITAASVLKQDSASWLTLRCVCSSDMWKSSECRLTFSLLLASCFPLRRQPLRLRLRLFRGVS